MTDEIDTDLHTDIDTGHGSSSADDSGDSYLDSHDDSSHDDSSHDDNTDWDDGGSDAGGPDHDWSDTDLPRAGEHPTDTHDDSNAHPAGCPCCSGTGNPSEQTPVLDRQPADNEHGWGETLGPARVAPSAADMQTDSGPPTIVPLDTASASSPANFATANPDIVTIGGGSPDPAFAGLLDDKPEDHPFGSAALAALPDLNSMPPATSAAIGNMLSHQAAANAAMTEQWVVPEGVNVDVAPESNSLRYHASDNAAFSSSSEAANHNRNL